MFALMPRRAIKLINFYQIGKDSNGSASRKAVACVARGGKGERRARKAREDRTRENWPATQARKTVNDLQ